MTLPLGILNFHTDAPWPAPAPGGFAGFLTTSMGGQRPFGMEGWRVVFFIVATISALVGCIVALLAADPRRRVRPGLE